MPPSRVGRWAAKPEEQKKGAQGVFGLVGPSSQLSQPHSLAGRVPKKLGCLLFQAVGFGEELQSSRNCM